MKPVPQCDYCRSPRPTWQYPCRSFEIHTEGHAEPWRSDGDWAACDACAVLIEADDWDTLSKRIIRQLAQELGPAGTAAHRRALEMTRQTQAGFRAHRYGTRKPIPLPPPPTTMASVYSRALDLQTDLITRMRRVAENERDPELRQELWSIHRCLSEAEGGYISPLVCSLLEQTCESVPDARFAPEDLIAPCMFVLLGTPWKLPHGTIKELPQATLTALSWAVISPPDRGSALMLTLWIEQHIGHPNPVPLVLWKQDVLASEAAASLTNPSGQPLNLLLFRWLLALNAFCAQQLITGRRGVPERAVRRRLERAGRPASDVLVVELRRTQQQHGEPLGERQIGTDFSFLVSGHWRRQWYESVQDHRPIWISPFVKGDTSKPLRPRRRVFAIVH